MAGFLGTLEDKIPEELKRLVELVKDGNKSVGKTGHEYSVVELKSDRKVEIFGEDVDLGANFKAELQIWEAGPVALFEDVDALSGAIVKEERIDPSVQPGDSRAFIESRLRFDANAKVSTSGIDPGGVQFTVGASGGAEFLHRHLLSVSTATKRGAAVEQLVKRTVWPQKLLEAKRPVIGVPEVHLFKRRLFLNLNVDANWGSDWDLGDLMKQSNALLAGLGQDFKLHVAATIGASLGWGLYTEFLIASGSFGLLNPEAIRVLMARTRKQELTLGATLTLQVEYNLGKNTAVSLVERAFDLVPGKELMKSLRKVNNWLAEVEEEARGQGLINGDNWSAGAIDLLRKRITGQAKEDLETFLGEKDLMGVADDVLLKFANLAKQLVEAFNSIEPRLASFWEEFLTRADLGPGSRLRQAVRALTEIDPSAGFDAITGFLEVDLKARLRLIESFTGLDLEELAFRDELRELLTVIQNRALKAQEVLNFIDGVPDDLWARFDEFAENTGLQATIDWLSANATSADALKKKANERIASFVARALGKGLMEIKDKDIDRLRKWAQTFDPKRLDELEEKVKEELQRLEGDFSLSLGVEWERVTSRGSIIDVEVHPEADSYADVAGAMSKGEVKGLFKVFAKNDEKDVDDDLVSEDAEPDEETRRGLVLREAMFTSSKISSFTFSFSILGLAKKKKRVSSRTRTLKIRETDKGFLHEAELEAGVVRTFEAEGKQVGARSQSIGTWLTCTASPTLKGTSLNAGVMKGASVGLKVRLTRLDVDTTPMEIQGLGETLNRLGFEVADADLQAIPDKAVVRSRIDLRFRQRAVEEILASGNSAGWSLDLRNAAISLFADPLAVKRGKPSKEYLVELVKSESFGDNFPWKKFKNEFLAKNVAIDLPAGKSETFPLVIQPANTGFMIRQGAINRLVKMRLRTFKEQRDRVAPTFDKVRGSSSFDEWETLLKPVTRQIRRVHIGSWSTPNFGFWFLLARVGRRNPALLREIQGVAIVQYRVSDDEDWRGPILSRLIAGVPEPAKGTGFLAV